MKYQILGNDHKWSLKSKKRMRGYLWPLDGSTQTIYEVFLSKLEPESDPSLDLTCSLQEIQGSGNKYLKNQKIKVKNTMGQVAHFFSPTNELSGKTEKTEADLFPVSVEPLHFLTFTWITEIFLTTQDLSLGFIIRFFTCLSQQTEQAQWSTNFILLATTRMSSIQCITSAQ